MSSAGPVLRRRGADGPRLPGDRVLAAARCRSDPKYGLPEPFRALRYRTYSTDPVIALFYNVGFFSLLAYTPYPMKMNASRWTGCLRLGHSPRDHLGLDRPRAAAPARPPQPMILAALTLFCLDLVIMALGVDSRAALAIGVTLSGLFLGVTNTLVAQAVIGVAPVERPMASAGTASSVSWAARSPPGRTAAQRGGQLPARRFSNGAAGRRPVAPSW